MITIGMDGLNHRKAVIAVAKYRIRYQPYSEIIRQEFETFTYVVEKEHWPFGWKLLYRGDLNRCNIFLENLKISKSEKGVIKEVEF